MRTFGWRGYVVKLYWAKAATALGWPYHWDGTMGVLGYPLGNYIGQYTLPAIEPGSAAIASFQWDPPDPQNYVGLGNLPVFTAEEPHHFCLLARIVAAADPMTVSETSILGDNVKKNNNIVMKNVSVYNYDPLSISSLGTSVLVGNAWEETQTFDFKFVNPSYYHGSPITDEAEITITLDDPLWEIWAEGGYQNDNMEIISEDERQVRLTSDEGILKNCTFDAHERYLMNVRFNFLTEEVSDKKEFGFDVLQMKTTDGDIVGGEHYVINREERPLFTADAGTDQVINRGDNATLSACQISEQAIYKWYNEDSVLIHDGTSLTVSPEVTTKYTLEVTAETDGFRDYDTVEVNVRQNFITDVFPNPSSGSNTIDINYKTHTATSAYLLLVPLTAGNSHQYTLDTALDSISINVSAYQTGQYAVLLFCDGSLADYKYVLIN